MTVAAIVPAAGRGERLGPGQPKALRDLGGVPMLVHAVRALSRARLVDLVVVAAPPGGVDEVKALLALHDIGAEVTVVAGGAERRDSVARALETLPPDVRAVLVHDAARPLAPPELVDAVAKAVLDGHQAVVPGVPIADTVKRISEAGEGGAGREGGGLQAHVVATLPRSDLRAIQTPQGFAREVLARAHADGKLTAVDDADLVERLGVPVVVVPGSNEAFEITRPIDLLFAEAVLAERRFNGAF
ncbi:MAG: 2-C-methyl-D-erythritol 4-phosphate cytidylyltransferase [Acidothermaceae bacterium]